MSMKLRKGSVRIFRIVSWVLGTVWISKLASEVIKKVLCVDQLIFKVIEVPYLYIL
jgi:hypothetical protein